MDAGAPRPLHVNGFLIHCLGQTGEYHPLMLSSAFKYTADLTDQKPGVGGGLGWGVHNPERGRGLQMKQDGCPIHMDLFSSLLLFWLR